MSEDARFRVNRIIRLESREGVFAAGTIESGHIKLGSVLRPVGAESSLEVAGIEFADGPGSESNVVLRFTQDAEGILSPGLILSGVSQT